MSPWFSNSPVTMDLVQEAGYHYTMDWTLDDQPVWLKTRGGRLLAMPYPNRGERLARHRLVQALDARIRRG